MSESDVRGNEYLFKLKLLGGPGDGSSCLLSRYITDLYEAQHTTTSVDFRLKTLQVDEDTVRLQIWEFPAREALRSIRQVFYLDVAAFILLYDTTKSLSSQIQRLRESCECIRSRTNTAPIYLLGTKKDLVEQRAVSIEEVDVFAKDYQLESVFECSALTGEGVEGAFETIARECLRSVNTNDYRISLG